MDRWATLEIDPDIRQRGTRARLYTRGRYSPTREAGVHHFHRLLTAALRGSAG